MVKNNLRILIIDDNPKIHQDFIKVLTTNKPDNNALEDIEKELFGTENNNEKNALPHFQIDTASQGQEGGREDCCGDKRENPYALAFVDIRMPPGWDGIETIKHIWAIDSDIQIVICTAYSDYSWEQTVAELGQRENLLILKKPFDHIAVRQLSCALTKKWQLLQESREYTKSLEENVKERTHLLQQSLSITRGTLESSADGIVVIDNDNHIIDFNNKLLEMWNIPASIIENKDGAALLETIVNQVEQPTEFLKTIKESSLQSDILKIAKLKTLNKQIFEHYSHPYKRNEKIAGRVWSFRDITKRALLEEQIAFQATHDTLTGLPNRALLTDRIQQMITIAKRNNTMFGILFFDLDRFKLINDSFSHSAGDQLLQLVAKRIKFAIRESDTIARLGGDEFIGVFSLNHEGIDLSVIAKKILDIFKKPFKVLNYDITVSASIGACIYPNDGDNVDTLLRNADIAMYRAKELGGNQFQCYSPGINKNDPELLAMETDMHNALEKKEFFLCYQPLIDLSTNQIVSVEALVRWQHPAKGLLLPIDFIQLAEKTDLIIPIGEWVLREACQQNKKWQEQGLPPIRVAVNVSTNQFKQANFVEVVKNILAETKLKPEYLELELTENLLITTAQASPTITELNKIGVHIALDDFGTGFSSLSYLSNIPIDCLKIDKTFVQNININNGDEVIIQAIISMANSLDLNVVAEGVETQKQLDFLKLKKCREIQGYYFSEPLHADEFEKVLRNPQLPHK